MKRNSEIRESGESVSRGAVPSLATTHGYARRILVADDNDQLRELLCEFFGRGGFQVEAVCDGEVAWEALIQVHYDILITDNDMPRLTGIRLVERVRHANMDIPVILVSGTLLTEVLSEFHPELRISALLSKPFSLERLMDRVNMVLLNQEVRK